MDDGSERPIAMVSRTLTMVKRGYAQIEKEGLSLIFGMKKFHMYLYGKSFTLITDHLPIVEILGAKHSFLQNMLADVCSNKEMKCMTCQSTRHHSQVNCGICLLWSMISEVAKVGC